MGKLSIGKYAALCMAYGSFLAGKAAELHTALFQLLPGYAGMDVKSWFLGAISIAVWSGVTGVYVAWMHNVSIQK